jgi:pilus assembly protein CpaB
VLPNDYVDVIRVENSAQRGTSSQIILRNVRVLAIGPNVGEKAGEKVALGQTATLELAPEQAEFLVSAMQGATIVLTLRSITESGSRKGDNEKSPTPARTIIRAGIATAF